MAAGAQDKSLTPGVKPPVLEAFKGSMDGETIPNFIHYCELYFSIESMSNRFVQALFTFGLLWAP